MVEPIIVKAAQVQADTQPALLRLDNLLIFTNGAEVVLTTNTFTTSTMSGHTLKLKSLGKNLL